MEFTGSHPPQNLQAYACAEVRLGCSTDVGKMG